ncbi:ribose-5-phosphate isomerase RpiA [Priestia koreensis]|uniref:ribose-5-phosphate isomerase RpiA n=1 Tax=Priestia koreensis TaxID=284581 RepID=UPI003459A2AC
MNEKQLVGEKAVEYVKDGMIVGLGTGSTVYYTILKLGKLVQEGLQIKGIPTSVQTAMLAKELNIPLVELKDVEHIDVAIDGADEVDGQAALIKGGGGALLREKIIARASKMFVVVADAKKNVQTLGKFSLPVEVVPFGFEMTSRHIAKLGCKPVLRLDAAGEAFISDNGNYILDCPFPEIDRPAELERALNMIPGVVENGLFVDMADVVITVDEHQQVKVTTV